MLWLHGCTHGNAAKPSRFSSRPGLAEEHDESSNTDFHRIVAVRIGQSDGAGKGGWSCEPHAHLDLSQGPLGQVGSAISQMIQFIRLKAAQRAVSSRWDVNHLFASGALANFPQTWDRYARPTQATRRGPRAYTPQGSSSTHLARSSRSPAALTGNDHPRRARSLPPG